MKGIKFLKTSFIPKFGNIKGDLTDPGTISMDFHWNPPPMNCVVKFLDGKRYVSVLQQTENGFSLQRAEGPLEQERIKIDCGSKPPKIQVFDDKNGNTKASSKRRKPNRAARKA